MVSHTYRRQGFTLIELVITLSIVAILAAIAAPSFADLLRQSRLTAQANDFLGTVQYARSEAINRGVQVTMLSRSGQDAVWEQGWDIFTDWDRDENTGDVGNNCVAENQDCWLRREDVLNNGITVRSGGTYARWISFDPIGEIRGSGGLGNDTFTICLPGSVDGREIVFNSSGSTRIVNGDGQC